MRWGWKKIDTKKLIAVLLTMSLLLNCSSVFSAKAEESMILNEAEKAASALSMLFGDPIIIDAEKAVSYDDLNSRYIFATHRESGFELAVAVRISDTQMYYWSIDFTPANLKRTKLVLDKNAPSCAIICYEGDSILDSAWYVKGLSSSMPYDSFKSEVERIISSLASGEILTTDEIRFLGIDWLSSVKDVKAMIKNKLTKDLPTGEFELSAWTAKLYKGDDYTVEDVPMYKLEYSGRYYYQVAGLNVKSIDLEFVPKGTDGTYSDKDTDAYQLVLARYCFDKDNVNDYEDVYAALEKKLRALYGEPVATLDNSDYTTYLIQTTKGFVWEGGNNTIVKLHHYDAYTSYTGTIEGVYITYAYGDKALFENKAALTLVSGGSGNVDVGQTDGL